jgi:hypothetical protein
MMTATALLTCTSDTSNPVVPPESTEPTIGIGLSFNTLSVILGQSVSITVAVTRGGGYTGAVALEVTEEPPGVSATLDATVIPNGVVNTTLTIATAPTMEPGTYELTITGSGAGVEDESASLVLMVMPVPVPSISVTLGSPTHALTRGDTGSVAVFVSRYGGYTGAIALAVTGAPAGLTATLSPSTVPPGAWQGRLMLAASGATALGSYTLTVTASGSGVASRSASLALTITDPPPPSISVGCVPLDDFIFVVQGDTWTWGGVTVTRHRGYTGTVELSVEGVPLGVTASLYPSVLDASMTESAITFTAENGAVPGSYLLTLRARGAGVSDATCVFRFAVFPPA